MRPTRHKILLIVFALFELFMLNTAAAVAVILSEPGKSKWLYNDLIINAVTIMQNDNLRVFWVLINLFSFVAIYHLNESKSNFRLTLSFKDIGQFIKAITACLIIFQVFAHFLAVKFITLAFNNYFIILYFIFLVIAKFLIGSALDYLRSLGYNSRTIAIVGINQKSLDFANYLENNKHLGFKILGFIDDQSNRTGHTNRHPTCCTLSEFKNFIRHNSLDEIAIFLPVRSKYDRIQELINTCQEHGIIVRYSSDIFNVDFSLPTRFASTQAGNFLLITLITGRLEGWQILLKRYLDILVSSILLILLFPLFVIVATIIKQVSPGPAFFKQERIGFNKRKFYLYKFRTMVVDAEQQIDQLMEQNEVSGPVFKIKKDPRIIPFGSLLRKTSIDELPQLFNVLVGNLSLVGPRPLPVRDFEGFYKDSHRRRFSVKPGITCTWQIKGRHEISFEEWMQLDLEYIDNWSLWLDIKILLQTIPAVLQFSKAS